MKSNLEKWLTDPRAQQYFGRAFVVKLDVLECLIAGGNLSEVARKHGLSRNTTSKQFRRAKAIFTS